MSTKEKDYTIQFTYEQTKGRAKRGVKMCVDCGSLSKFRSCFDYRKDTYFHAHICRSCNKNTTHQVISTIGDQYDPAKYERDCILIEKQNKAKEEL